MRQASGYYVWGNVDTVKVYQSKDYGAILLKLGDASFTLPNQFVLDNREQFKELYYMLGDMLGDFEPITLEG